MSDAVEGLVDDTIHGFLDRTHPQRTGRHPAFIDNVDGNTMFMALRNELRRADEFSFSVAFISSSRIALLKQALVDFSGNATIITSTYLNFNEPDVFRELKALDNVTLRVHKDPRVGFHPKGYLFREGDDLTAIVGSSNLTNTALLSNSEWNLKVSSLPGGDITRQIDAAIKRQISDSILVTEEWIDAYEKARPPLPPAQAASLPATLWDDAQVIVANAMQQEALENLSDLRSTGARRALIISATGTGKTILAALSARQIAPKRLLFLAHREQILDKALEEFQKVLSDIPPERFGTFVGQRREDADFLFASVQSLGREDNLHQFERDHFDYIIIDEVHRAGARTYQQIIDYFTPNFLLGLTATPERSDSFNIYELFDFNVPYEIRLDEALRNDMLVPFYYYGVTDYIDANGDTIDDASTLAKLTSTERVTHLVAMLERYSQASGTKGLIFCSSIAEARELSVLLDQETVQDQRLRTVALTGEDSQERRQEVVAMLERGEIDYVLTRDIFNEGIDIPQVNQVVMLRQTESAIIFTQQLGRGLRKAPIKDHLRVIDFIGNYANSYLVPVALFGDNSLNRDSLRKRIIDTMTDGTVSGLSAVNFDEIARERVLDAIQAAPLNHLRMLKEKVLLLQQRLGRIPDLYDFVDADIVDPVVLATREGNYWALLAKLYKGEVDPPSPGMSRFLTFITVEFVNGMRPQELLLLRGLLDGETTTRTEFVELLHDESLGGNPATVSSVERIFTLEFFTASKAKNYGHAPLTLDKKGHYRLSDEVKSWYASDPMFKKNVDDVINTGLFLARHVHDWSSPMEIGSKYTRKDVCRLLDWPDNEYSVMYGYKANKETNTCPIFVTYHKADDISESIRYQEHFEDQSTLRWSSKINRKLTSAELQPILANDLALHVFVKKDDEEGTDYFYLGRAQAGNAEEAEMSDGKGSPKPVVFIDLHLDVPVPDGIYDYLTTTPTS